LIVIVVVLMLIVLSIVLFNIITSLNLLINLIYVTQVDRLNLKTVETVKKGCFVLVLTRLKSG